MIRHNLTIARRKLRCWSTPAAASLTLRRSGAQSVARTLAEVGLRRPDVRACSIHNRRPPSGHRRGRCCWPPSPLAHACIGDSALPHDGGSLLLCRWAPTASSPPPNEYEHPSPIAPQFSVADLKASHDCFRPCGLGGRAIALATPRSRRPLPRAQSLCHECNRPAPTGPDECNGDNVLVGHLPRDR